jgi:hypothetical protein
VHHPAFAMARVRVRDAAEAIAVQGAEAGISPHAEVEAGAREFSMAIARTTAGALLLAQAQWALAQDAPDGGRSRAAALRWCERTLGPPPAATAARLAATRSLLRTAPS